jgi:hypothetical protein
MTIPAKELAILERISSTFFDMMGFPGALAFCSPVGKSNVIRTAIIGMIVLIPLAFTNTSGPLPSFMDDFVRKCHGISPPRSISK